MEATLESTLADALVDVALVKYRPGDVLVLRYRHDRPISFEQIERMRTRFETEFGGQLKLMILSDDLSIHGLIRAESDARQS
jgi:hypothetical protein